MTGKQISVLRRYIKENQEMSNSALSKIIVEKSNTFKGYSPGSIANYLGKVKRLPKETVETKSGRVDLPTSNSSHTHPEGGSFVYIPEVKTSVDNDSLTFKTTSEPGGAEEETKVMAPETEGYEMVVLSSKDDMARQDWSTYMSFGCDNKLFTVYDEEINTITAKEEHRQGGVFNETKSSGYRLYDAIDSAIAVLFSKVKDPKTTPVNITIISERGIDFDSKATEFEVSELIRKVTTRFGWNINFVSSEMPSENVGFRLGIDSSNTLTYSDPEECLELLTEAKSKYMEGVLGGEINYLNYFNV